MRKSVCIIEMGLLLFLALVFSAATGLERQQQRISDSMIRLHVVANSDNPGDQAIKFNVRDAVLSDAQDLLQHTTSRDEAMNVLASGLPQLTETANKTLRQLGASDRATVTLKRELFGTRYYDTFTLPGGYYEALRVTIGEGDGKNWWCVVYPPLCTAACTDMEQVAIDAGLSGDDVKLITEEDGYVLRFRAMELWQRLRQWLGK